MEILTDEERKRRNKPWCITINGHLYIQCGGCDTVIPWDDPAEGWTTGLTDGLWYCNTCSNSDSAAAGKP